jgi:hypothetical protein
MNMTPAKMAFIKGEEAKTKSSVELAADKPVAEKTIDVAIAPDAVPDEPAKDERPRVSRRTGKGRSEQHSANEVLDQVLVPVTIRLPHRIAQALRRAHLEQRLRHAKPDTQQEIAEEALGDWLNRRGFLD